MKYVADSRKGNHVTRIYPDRSETPLTPERSWQHGIAHSTEFTWGYGGNGSAQLAFALLLDATDDVEFSRRVYQRFKQEIIATLPEAWELDRVHIVLWSLNQLDMKP